MSTYPEQIQYDVSKERQRQDDRWGIAELHKRNFLAILVEEVGEVATCEVDDERPQRLYEELIQVQAVVQAWAEALLRKHPRARKGKGS